MRVATWFILKSKLPDPIELPETILAVVRGCIPWWRLNDFDALAKKTAIGWSFAPVQIRPILINGDDIRSGLSNLINDSERMKEWASFLLAASSLVDLQELESERGGDNLFELIWDLQSSRGVTDDGIRICHLAED